MLKERIVVLQKRGKFRVINLITHDDRILIGDFQHGISKMLHSFSEFVEAESYFNEMISEVSAEDFKVMADESIAYPF